MHSVNLGKHMKEFDMKRSKKKKDNTGEVCNLEEGFNVEYAFFASTNLPKIVTRKLPKMCDRKWRMNYENGEYVFWI